MFFPLDLTLVVLSSFEGFVSFFRTVPFTWHSLHFLSNHWSLAMDVEHILGWKSGHCLPRLHPLPAFVPCFMSLVHRLGCKNLHSFPLIPNSHLLFL